MSSSSTNHYNSAIRGGTGATRTPANTTSNPDSKAASSTLSGMFASEKPGAPKKPVEDSMMNIKSTPKYGKSGLGKVAENIKDTLGTSG